jgi:hypothetical protein
MAAEHKVLLVKKLANVCPKTIRREMMMFGVLGWKSANKQLEIGNTEISMGTKNTDTRYQLSCCTLSEPATKCSHYIMGRLMAGQANKPGIDQTLGTINLSHCLPFGICPKIQSH